MNDITESTEFRELVGKGAELGKAIKEGLEDIQAHLDEAYSCLREEDFRFLDESQKEVKSIRLMCGKIEKNVEALGDIKFKIEEMQSMMLETQVDA